MIYKFICIVRLKARVRVRVGAIGLELGIGLAPCGL